MTTPPPTPTPPQIRELFEVEGELRPCPPAAVLAGVLGCLRDAHWCAAVGCPPEPIFAVPISLEVRQHGAGDARGPPALRTCGVRGRGVGVVPCSARDLP
jgi:hypothetical protein